MMSKSWLHMGKKNLATYCPKGQNCGNCEGGGQAGKHGGVVGNVEEKVPTLADLLEKDVWKGTKHSMGH